jgi:hypothetical protein
MSKAKKVSIPTTKEECVAGGFETRSYAIYITNEWTKKTEQQHRIVKLSDGKWYVYNGVHPDYRF